MRRDPPARHRALQVDYPAEPDPSPPVGGAPVHRAVRGAGHPHVDHVGLFDLVGQPAEPEAAKAGASGRCSMIL